MKPEALEPKEISQTQWEFSKCPPDELLFCCSYEYLREVAAIERERIGDKWTVLNFETAFDRYFKDGKLHYYSGASDGRGDGVEINLAARRGIGQIVSKCNGFPDRPFLQLRPEERQSWVKGFNLDQLRYDRPTMVQESFFEVCLDQKKAAEMITVHFFEWAKQIGNKKVKGKPRCIVDYDGFKFEVGAVRLNWSVSNKQLLNDFKAWLESNRPENVDPMDYRGSASPAEKLKYLSAYRLLKTMTVTKAHALTKKVLGETLYLSDDNWYDADKRAQKLIKEYAVPFFNWA